AITVSNLAYDVRMNDVVVGNGTATAEHRIPAGETRTVTFTIPLDSQAMDEWWVSHVRNGERTVVEYDATVAVEARDRSERARVVSTTSTVETDFLDAAGEESGRLVSVESRPSSIQAVRPAEASGRAEVVQWQATSLIPGRPPTARP
ncbi:MAG: hypothetical protein ACI91T_001558, partial [Natronomonas sp.]